jgi:benzoyl-CoA-dihydrodiol lyase
VGPSFEDLDLEDANLDLNLDREDANLDLNLDLEDACLEDANLVAGEELQVQHQAEELGLVTFALDDIDWDDEVRVFFEERTSFSPDGLTGMEANLRFVGPETMESKIFSRLTAWQNWIFQRPNAVGEDGALRRYGTGQKAQFDMTRV